MAAGLAQFHEPNGSTAGKCSTSCGAQFEALTCYAIERTDRHHVFNITSTLGSCFVCSFAVVARLVDLANAQRSRYLENVRPFFPFLFETRRLFRARRI